MAQRVLPVVRDSAAGAEARIAGRLEAQAYCGPAHGQHWSVDPQDGPPVEIFFPVDDADRACYRLILDPLTGRPARDHQDRYLYMPVRYQPALPCRTPVLPR